MSLSMVWTVLQVLLQAAFLDSELYPIDVPYGSDLFLHEAS